jgi:hypothetical protein
MEWISVSDPPENGSRVIALLGHGAIWDMKYKDGTWTTKFGYRDNDVIGWIPVPDIPKEG